MERTTNEQEITLYFNDESIAAAFGDLLDSLGFQTRAVQSLTELASADKVITEPLFYEALTPVQQEQCLLIGNQFTSRELDCPVIRQPLTPTKIQEGLQAFLGASLGH